MLAGLTPVIQGIPDAIAHSPTVQAANKATTQGAVCEIAQPGGCLGNALDNTATGVISSIWSAVNGNALVRELT